jgi:hypothetical protein
MTTWRWGGDKARAARTERTRFRRNLRRPTVPPPSVHMVRPVRIFLFYFFPLFFIGFMSKESLKFIN